MQHHYGGEANFLPVAVALGALAYSVLVLRQHSKGRNWNLWRTASYLAGSALLILGLNPGILPFAEGDFRKHMVQHLLIGMYAPIGLVMAAPVTLLLGMLPVRHARLLTAFLRTPATRLISHPITALILNLGGMAALYFTRLYSLVMSNSAWHQLVHVHFIAAGCLYAWVIAGPDPAPHRVSVPVRLTVLGIAVVVHSVLAQMLYAGAYVAVPVPEPLRERSAELMYYGGDIAEMLLAVACVTTWRPGRAAAYSRC